MILEVATLRVRPGRAAEFEAAFQKAQIVLAAAAGYLSHELRRCVERPDEYVLLVHWESVEAHEVSFRQSPGYEEWRRLLHHFFEPRPVVAHYKPVPQAY